MTPSERRAVLAEILCTRRFETTANLALELNVSESTIARDLRAIAEQYPFEPVRGRYGGGIRIAKGFRADRKILSAEQMGLLKKLRNELSGQELEIMDSILVEFGTLRG